MPEEGLDGGELGGVSELDDGDLDSGLGGGDLDSG